MITHADKAAKIPVFSRTTTRPITGPVTGPITGPITRKVTQKVLGAISGAIILAMAPALPAMAHDSVHPAPGAAHQIQRTIELNVFEKFEIEPDLATIGAGVTTRAPSAVEAMRQNSARMQQVIDRLKAAGVEGRDIQTSRINLYAQYDYDRDQKRQIFRGYQASNQVTVKFRDLDKTGQILDALVAAGATDLNGPTFSVQDDSAARDAARARAFETAYQRALSYAKMAGYSDVRLILLSESLISGGPVPVATQRALMADAVEESIPIEAGRISSGVSISVSYEMVE